MQRVLKWAGYGLAGVVAAVAVAGLGGLVASEVILRMPQDKPASRLAATMGPDAVARGHAIATMQGCVDCHGANLQGKMFDNIPNVVTLYAPNLSLAVAEQSDADLDRAIRHGVGSDGRPLWVMPSATFAHLTDAETADLIAYLRSVKPGGAPQPRFKVGPVGRLGVLMGKFRSEAAVIQAHENPALPDFGPQHARGRDLARACVECHGPALKGGDGIIRTPDLMIAAAYDPADFERLLHTGVAAGDRHVGLMSEVAKVRFAHLSHDDVAALQAYLKARADRMVAAAETKSLPKT
jgi:cytochrome c553